MSDHASDSYFLAIRLDEDEDFYPALKHIFVKEGLDTAVLISGVGMLREAELGWFDGKNYLVRTYQAPHEILALSGTVNRKPDGSVFVHCHSSLGDREHRAFGGHLIRGRVYQSCELVFALPQALVFHRQSLQEGQPPRFCPRTRKE